MKLNNLILSMSASCLAIGMVSCENDDISFPNYDGGTSVYFAYQYPIRTLILGDIDTYDNSSDNSHRFTIYGTCGGSYKGVNAVVDVDIDESLIENLTFEDGTPLKMLPSEYYSLGEKKLNYGGDYRGGIDVQLTEAFFGDPECVKNTYVLPIVMKSATGVDNILVGEASTSNPIRQKSDDWYTLPKDYTIFCVNYINKYDANYLRRGVDEFSIPAMPYIQVSSDDMVDAAWDSQFWIMSEEEFVSGKEWELTMDVKADKAASIGTQTHKGAGEYLHWAAVGNVNFTTEWQTLNFSGKFDNSQAGGKSIALNLNDLAEANNYYFNNVSFKVDGKEVLKKGDDETVVSGNFYKKEKRGAVVKLANPHPAMSGKVVRHKEFVEKDEVIKTTTKDYYSVVMSVSGLMKDGEPVSCDLLLTFNENGECNITSATEGYEVSGSGKYLKDSEKKAWGNKDRDGLYLNYTIDLGVSQYSSTDTLVWRDRGTAASIQEYKPVYTK